MTRAGFFGFRGPADFGIGQGQIELDVGDVGLQFQRAGVGFYGIGEAAMPDQRIGEEAVHRGVVGNPRGTFLQKIQGLRIAAEAQEHRAIIGNRVGEKWIELQRPVEFLLRLGNPPGLA